MAYSEFSDAQLAQKIIYYTAGLTQPDAHPLYTPDGVLHMKIAASMALELCDRENARVLWEEIERRR